MKVLVCGSKTLPPEKVASVRSRLLQIKQATLTDSIAPAPTLVHNNESGPAKAAAEAAKEWGWSTVAFPVNRFRDGQWADLKSNTLLMQQTPDLVLVFAHGTRLGRGLNDIIRKAQAAGVKVEIHQFPKLKGE